MVLFRSRDLSYNNNDGGAHVFVMLSNSSVFVKKNTCLDPFVVKKILDFITK